MSKHTANRTPKIVKTHRTVHHQALIPVVENLDQHMYLRQEIGTGQADDGTPIEISTTGPHIIIQLGRFPNGRQFLISIADMTTAVLTALTQPTTGGPEAPTGDDSNQR